MILDEIEAKKVQAQDLIDRRYLNALEKSGFFKQLLGKQGSLGASLLRQLHLDVNITYSHPTGFPRRCALTTMSNLSDFNSSDDKSSIKVMLFALIP